MDIQWRTRNSRGSFARLRRSLGIGFLWAIPIVVFVAIVAPIFSPDDPAFWEARQEIAEFNFITGRWPSKYQDLIAVLPVEDLDTKRILNIQPKNAALSSCKAVVTIKSDLWPYDDDVQSHRINLLTGLLHDILAYEHGHHRWPNSISAGYTSEVERLYHIKSAFLLHSSKEYCDVEVKSHVDGRLYSYTLRVRDSDKGQDYLYGGKYNN